MAEKENNENILKVRDDNEPIKFTVRENKYVLCEGVNCSWINNEEFSVQELRTRIEPWLTALFQSEHLSLLVGSGLTRAISRLAKVSEEDKKDSVVATMDNVDFSVFSDCIKEVAEETAKKACRENGNFEDEIRTANELLRGLEILKRTNGKEIFDDDKYKILSKKTQILKEETTKKLEEFVNSILKNEKTIFSNADNCRDALNTLVNFLMSFASRNGTRDRLQIFTTNYDRILEEGADLAGLRLIDRFVGVLNPIFRSSRIEIDMHYNTPGIRGEPRYLEGVAHYTKLHGSIDWIQTGEYIRKIGLPLGADSIEPYLNAIGFQNADAQKLMIYPNSAKDTETAQYPYVEMFRDFAAAICRPNSTIITYGYSFGDDHINRVIKDMLTIPSTHLMIISYNDEPLGRIMNFYKTANRNSQISLLVGNELGDFKKLIENYLPKSAIDKSTYRLNEILKERYGLSNEKDRKTDSGEKLK